MIDLHCHMLPFVDDGANTIIEALEMGIEAKREGINKILLTPHYMDGEYVNHKKDIVPAVKNLQRIFIDNGIDIELRAGQEIHINGELINQIENDDILYPDKNTKRYIMFEFPHGGIPKYSNDIIFELKLRGITPIIVHPERNMGFQKKPSMLYDLVSQGCLTQITATSFTGGFGKRIQKFTDEIVEANLGFVFSSDAHNLKGRRFMMDEAFSRLENKYGSSVVNEYKRNSELIWNGDNVSIGDIDRIKNKKRFSDFLRNIF
ncbi:tyrosine protein phosphatase [Apilactobacillus kunkeei]|uniref:tyrosine-protein phosphatase n=1 Tax=Apilactobacillus kunkeei TaxID=148814 RepID=UPI00110D112C|nr:CpsB/CapC family capsule biosynthesis tyrosine phosphatase [Apilactobacillus kunkeei]TMT01283.1 tyrosine protein phosphatase [Apilactobacillus kunkeei]